MKNLFTKVLRRPELVFLCITTFFGILSVISMPILGAPDENQHFQVEYAIFSSHKAASQDLVLSESIVQSYVKNGYSGLFTNKTSAQNDGVGVNTGSRVFDKRTSASIKDLFRLPQALGIAVGRIIYPSIGSMVLTGRIFNLAVYIAILYFIIKKVKYGKWAFLFIACLPMMIQQAASLSYDSNNLLIIFAWVAYIINTFSWKSTITRRQIILGLGLIGLLMLSKPSNVFLLALLLVLPSTLVTNTTIYKKVRGHKYWLSIRNIAITLFIISVFVAGYIMGQKLLAGQAFHPRRLFDVLLNTYIRGDNLALIDVVVNGMIGFFSNFYYHLPMWSVVIAFVVLFIALLHEKFPNVSKRFAAISGLLFFGSILIISVGMYYAWAIQPVRLGPNANVTDGIQGRYFTPLLILLFPMFAYLQKYIRIEAKSPRVVPILVSTTSVLLLTLFIYQTWQFFWA